MTGDGSLIGIEPALGSAPAQSKPTQSRLAESRPEMTADQVIAALTFIPQGTSPRAAIEAALGMREELLPRLAAELSLAPLDLEQRYEDAPEGTSYYLHEIAMHLLAAWRAPQGWSLILDYFVSDSDLAMEQQDIGAEAYLPAILVRCYDCSDLGYLEKLIETNGLDVLFRHICLQAYHGLVISGRASRERFVEFLHDQLAALDGQEPGDWDEWLCLTAAELREPALRSLVEKRLEVCTRRSNGLSIITARDLLHISEETPTAFVRLLLRDEHFDNLSENLETWAWFRTQELPVRPAALPWSAAATFLPSEA